MLEQLELPLEKKTEKPKPRFRVEELTRSEQDLEIYDMAKGFAEEVTLDEYIDLDTLVLSCAAVRQDIERKHLNVFIAYLGDEAVGFLVGVTTPCFHRPAIVAEQKLWYVRPERRASYAAIHLVRAYERWARINGATQIYTGSANTPFTERTSKLLEKLGYARTGTLHVKEI